MISEPDSEDSDLSGQEARASPREPMNTREPYQVDLVGDHVPSPATESADSPAPPCQSPDSQGITPPHDARVASASRCMPTAPRLDRRSEFNGDSEGDSDEDAEEVGALPRTVRFRDSGSEDVYHELLRRGEVGQPTTVMEPAWRRSVSHGHGPSRAYHASTPRPVMGREPEKNSYHSFLEDYSLEEGRTGTGGPRYTLVKPRMFTGTNWPGYRLHFLSVAQANGWSANEAACVLKACLSEGASLVLRRGLRQRNAGLEDIFRCLDERYLVAGPDYVLKGRLRRTMQKPGQSLDAYQMELMGLLAHQADAEDSPRLLEQFIYGLLDPHMQKHVAKRQPVDAHEALRLCKEFEETNAWVSSATRRTTRRIGAVDMQPGRLPDNTREARNCGLPDDEPVPSDVEVLQGVVSDLRAKNRHWRSNQYGGRGRGRGGRRPTGYGYGGR